MKTSQLVKPKFRFQGVLEWVDWREELCRRLALSALFDIPHLRLISDHPGVCFIIGGGSSCSEFRETNSEFDIVMSVNGAHQWLVANRKAPNIHVISEYDLDQVSTALGGQPQREVTYYISSHCHPDIFEQLSNTRRVLWHSALPPQEFQAEVARIYPSEPMVNAGHATFFKSLAIGCILGYRNFEIFGVDSSCGSSSHVAGYAMADIEPKIKVWATDPRSVEAKEFTTQGGLAFQAVEFLEFCEAYHPELRIKVHGDGMLRYLHEGRYPELYKD